MVVLTWYQVGGEDPITPPYYNDRLTPVDLGEEESGSTDQYTLLGTDNEVGFPTGSIGTGWLAWTAPYQTEFTGTFEFSETVTLTVFVDGVQVDEVTGDTAEIEDLEVPEGGVVEFRVATLTGGGSIDSFVWSVASEPAEPANPNLFQYIRVEIYEPDGAVKITEVPRRLSPTFQIALNEQGSGEVTLLMSDPIVQAYKDTLFHHRNVVKFFIDDVCIFAFRIRGRSTTFVSSDEYSGLVRTISGPSIENLLDDAIVMHDRPPTDISLDFRKYSWASPRSTDNDAWAWHHESDWTRSIPVSDFRDPPGEFTDPDTPEPVEDRAKHGFPKQWPDDTAKWMFIYQDKRRNAAFGQPTDDFTAAEWENRYYRRTWFLEEKSIVRFHATADETFTLYLDGEEIIRERGFETGYKSFSYIDIELDAGWHTNAAYVVAKKSTLHSEDGTDAFLFSAMEVTRAGRPINVIINSGRDWEAYYGDDVPGWNRAHILLNFWNEARRRGHHIGDVLTPGFTGDEDSEGKEWNERNWNKEVSIGMKGTELVTLLSETGKFDVWIEPDEMILHAAKKRGKNRTTSIKLEPGRNVLDWSVESIDEVENYFLVQYDGGWINHDVPSSIRNYGLAESFISLGDVQYRAGARRIMNGLTRGLSWARTKSGSDDIKKKAARQPQGSVIAVHGAAPFFDYDLGDTVTAMKEDGEYGPHRILGISVTEDDTGSLSYDLDLEVVKNA